MGKLRESCLSGQSDFKTNREMSYPELEEKYNHFRKTAHQYEKLYGQYLEKFIIAEKERVVLEHQTRRAAYLIQKTAWAQAKWDASTIDERKRAISGCGIASGICCLIIFISMLTSWNQIFKLFKFLLFLLLFIGSIEQSEMNSCFRNNQPTTTQTVNFVLLHRIFWPDLILMNK